MIGDKKNNPNKVSNAYDADSSSKDSYSDRANVSDKEENKAKNSTNSDKTYEVEPLPESSRPRKDGPGGN